MVNSKGRLVFAETGLAATFILQSMDLLLDNKGPARVAWLSALALWQRLMLSLAIIASPCNPSYFGYNVYYGRLSSGVSEQPDRWEPRQAPGPRPTERRAVTPPDHPMRLILVTGTVLLCSEIAWDLRYRSSPSRVTRPQCDGGIKQNYLLGEWGIGSSCSQRVVSRTTIEESDEWLQKGGSLYGEKGLGLKEGEEEQRVGFNGWESLNPVVRLWAEELFPMASRMFLDPFKRLKHQYIISQGKKNLSESAKGFAESQGWRGFGQRQDVDFLGAEQLLKLCCHEKITKLNGFISRVTNSLAETASSVRINTHEKWVHHGIDLSPSDACVQILDFEDVRQRFLQLLGQLPEHLKKDRHLPLFDYHAKKTLDVILKEMESTPILQTSKGAATSEVIELVKRILCFNFHLSYNRPVLELGMMVAMLRDSLVVLVHEYRF
ncbi:putative adenine nucleotide transporter [Nymphaea thermarum]|nr:putative adenine nucleotide transporter [Nymphaea thermarum]